MQTVNLTDVSPKSRELAQTIAQRAGVNLRDCYQCGKCSAGCPMADEMDLTPQQIMRELQLGLVDRALDARGPWLCAQCMVCTARCPQNIDITAIMHEVRMESHYEGRNPVPESETFENQFMSGVRSDGRSNEQYLAAFYNLKSGHLMQDMTSAPRMLTKGLIGVSKNTVKDRDAVRKLVDKCLDGKPATTEKGGE